ncbi:hypothetical protein [Persephonella sp.]|uniref:hypothetical protein n=1 Tax=Persephonella sp. TaxID=2060922 RepID=UPI00263331E9|nr:hypothetical protein [Persephonella sp.]
MMEYIYELIEKIKNQQIKILELERELFYLKEVKADKEKEKKDIEATVWNEVVFDKELKNEAQRKARYQQKLEEWDAYLGVLDRIAELEKKISDLIYQIKKENIELDYLKRLYEIEKLKKEKEEAVS